MLINPETRQADTLAPEKVEFRIEKDEGPLAKTIDRAHGRISYISGGYSVNYSLQYQVTECDRVISFDYSIPAFMLGHAPGSRIDITMLSSDFSHPFDGMYYYIGDEDQIFFFEIKILPKECESFYMCQDPENPDIPIAIEACETVDTSVPEIETEDLGHGHFVHRVTWPYSSYRIEVTPPYHYEIQMADTVRHKFGVPIQVIPVDENGETYSAINPDLPILLETDDAGSSLGRFIRFVSDGGSPLAKESSIMILQAIFPLRQLMNGQIMYLADGCNPVIPVPVLFTVRDPYDVSTERTATVVGQKDTVELKLEIPAPKEIWPTLRDRDGCNPNSRNIKNNIQVSLMKNGLPVADQNITLTIEMILPSGGHDHTNPPPRERMPYLTGIGSQTISGDSTITVPTNDSGSIMVSCLADSFSGDFVFKATTEVDDKTFETTDTLKIRVPGLELLPESNYYFKVSGSCRHHGPGGGGDCELPDNAHWGQTNFNNILEQIADEYSIFAMDSLKQNGLRLQIGHLSLPEGGLYDYRGNCSRPHASHRIGRNADILGQALVTNTDIDIDHTQMVSIITNICKKKPITDYQPIHYHVRF